MTKWSTLAVQILNVRLQNCKSDSKYVYPDIKNPVIGKMDDSITRIVQISNCTFFTIQLSPVIM